MKLIYGQKHQDEQNTLNILENDLDLPFASAYWEKPILFLNELSKKNFDSKIFPENFLYKEYSLWWAIIPNISPSLCGAINFITAINKLLDSHNFSEIHISGDFQKFEILKNICEKRKIKFSYDALDFFKFKTKEKIKNKIQSQRYKKIFLEKISKRTSIFKNIKYSLTNKVLLFSATVYRRPFFNYNLNKTIKGEYLLYPIIDYAHNTNLEILGIDVDYTFKGDFQVSAERLQDEFPWIGFENLLHFENNAISFVKNYQNIISKKEFQNLFIYDGIYFWDMVKTDFEKICYAPYLYFFINIIDSLVDLLKNQKPRSVIIPYEKGSLAICLTIACKLAKIKCIGIQHGGFHLLKHIDYSHESIFSENNKGGIPIPDQTFVYGNEAKNFLIKKGYPEKMISVFGNPEYFNLKQMLSKFDKEKIMIKYKIPKNKKIILFTTSKLQSAYTKDGFRNYDEQVLKKLLEGFDQDVHIILKPHPANEPIENYEKIINSLDSKICSIVKGNLHELLYISDVLVSVESTTLLDGIIIGTNVIEVKFNENSFLPKEENNVCISTNIEDLSESIKHIISDDNSSKNMRVNQEDFLKRHYNIPNEIFEQIMKKHL